MKKIAVIGAGTMGNGIAHTFAQKNYQVTLIDVSEQSLEKALSTISKNLDRMVSKDKISESEKSQTLANIQTSTEINKDVLHQAKLNLSLAGLEKYVELQNDDKKGVRSLNLSVACGIAIYEAYKQLNF